MTATPIPRSLALTLYGDLDLSIIDELPPGRRPVRTVIRDDAARTRLMAFLRREVAAGGRVYIVFPMIEGRDDLRGRALEDQLATVRHDLPGLAVEAVHGRMPAVERERVLTEFRDGRVHVLLATTVVEVGVDVPEASVMVVESADRFGLSQLHQLRGRVGRGDRPSWCVLMVEEDVSDDARRRLEVLCGTGDGFEVAEQDLRLRGPGELTGTRQWGPSQFRFADLLRHRDLVASARAVAVELAETGRLPAVLRRLAVYHPIQIELPPG